MRSGVDTQKAAAVGSIVWVAGNFRGWDDRLQQCGQIAERISDSSGFLPTGCDCNGTEWGDFER
jgi:hypothetical protein